MNVANVILLDADGVRLVRAGDTYAVRGPLCVRIEPAFVFHELTLAISVSRSNEQKISRAVRKVSRDTIAVFEEIPATQLGLHTVELAFNDKPLARFSIDIGQEATQIISSAFREQAQSSFYRNRYRVHVSRDA